MEIVLADAAPAGASATRPAQEVEDNMAIFAGSEDECRDCDTEGTTDEEGALQTMDLALTLLASEQWAFWCFRCHSPCKRVGRVGKQGSPVYPPRPLGTWAVELRLAVAAVVFVRLIVAR